MEESKEGEPDDVGWEDLSEDWKKMKRGKLSQKLSVPRKNVFQLIEELGWENFEFYRSNPRTGHSESFIKSCQHVIRLGAELEPLAQHFLQIAAKYDFDDETPGNGYRSLVCVVDTTLLHLVHLLGRIQEQRSWLVFRAAQVAKELEAFIAVLQFLSSSFAHVSRFQREHPTEDLFPAPDQKERAKDLLYIVEELDSSCFYGRAMGFQYCKTVGQVFQVIGIVLATYSVGWEKKTGLIGSLVSSGKLFLSPELRAQRIIHYVRHADVTFCKGFWNLSEGQLFQQVPEWFCPPMALNEVQDIPADISLKVRGRDGEEIMIPAPRAFTGIRPITLRILSYRLRDGMVSFKSKEGGRFSKKTERAPRSSRLLFHCHGGGFVATSSKSHETYLRHWAKNLDCPLLSVDYSLAPDNPYPRAVEEVLYAYAWALLNPERLGWTGEKICFTGDSAGGNLLAAVTLRVIQLGFARLPDGLVLAYTPFFSEYLPSPSRLLCAMDPLLPPGIILRCLAAYTNNLELLKEKKDPEQGPEAPKVTSPSSERKSLKKYNDDLERQKKLHNGGSKMSGAEGSDEIVSLINISSRSNSSNQLKGSRKGSECSSDEEDFHTPTEESVPPLDSRKKEKDSPPQFSLNAGDPEDEEAEGAESGRPKMFRQRSRSIDSDVSGRMTDEEEEEESSEEGPMVEIHKDPSRIWLTSSVCDSQLVDYLSGHRLTKESLVVVEDEEQLKSEHSNRTSGTKPQLGARASVTELEAMDSKELGKTGENGKKKKKLGPTTSGGHSRSKSMGSLTKSISMGVTGTVALATGHAYDQLGTWIRKPNQDTLKEETQLGMNSEKNPLRILRKMVVPPDMLLSPMYAPDEILRRMPPCHLVVSHMDPLLDDSICFGKKLRRLGTEVTVDLLDSLPHGFLNFTLMSPECRDAAKVCLSRIRTVLNT